MPKHDTIEFEDLHGNPDPQGEGIEVDLDAAGPPDIRRKPARLDDEPGGEGGLGDDDFDDLPGSRRSESRTDDRDDRGKKGNSFDARLERERAALKREREAREAAERRAQEAEARLREREKAASAQSLEQLDTQIADTESKLEQALENEDTKAQVKLTSQLTDLKARRIAAEYTRDASDDSDSRGSPPPAPMKNEALDQFTDSIADWFKRPGFERQTRLLYRLDKEVHRDGFDPMDPEYFEELTRRMREKAPELFDDEGDDPSRDRDRQQEDDRRRQKGRSPVAGADRDVDGRFKSRQNDRRIQLTAEDFANMRNFGLNPDDPEVLREYARNKRQSVAEGSR